MPIKDARKPAFPLPRTMVWLLLVSYCLFLVGRSTYKNYQINKDITRQKDVVASLESQKHNLELSLFYYHSNSYKEVEARRRLNLKGKDEHVVALPQATTEPVLAIVTQRQIKASAPRPNPIYLQWWLAFFGTEKS